MLFADTALAARIERAECHLISGCVAAIAQRRGNADTFVRPVAGGVATFTGPGSPLNKVAGLGFGGPFDAAEFDEIERLSAQRQTPVQVEISTLADPAVAECLTRRGYTLVGFENILGLRLPAATTPETAQGVAVARSNETDFAQWLDVVIRGFASPDTQGVPSHEPFDRAVAEQIMTDMTAAPSFIRYLARRDDTVAGGASMCVNESENVALLCGAATLPEHRRRGVQTVLLAARLREAAEFGCDVAIITTLPGSKSQQNAQRRGFELLYARAVLRRDSAEAR